jgi:hypothetical protein
VADIAFAHRAKQGVADGMDQHIGIGMPFEALRVRNLHPAKEKQPAFNKAVDVVTDANMDHAGTRYAAPGSK